MRRFIRLVGLIVRLLWVASATVAISTLILIGIGPPTGAYQIRTVLTGSMRPNMPEGSVVMVRPVAPGKLKIGDVITYKIPVDDRRIVTHRIVEITEPGPQPVVKTQGDANQAPDPWVARLRGDQAWRVQLSVRGVGFALASLRRPAVRHLMVLAAPALLGVATLVRIWLPSKEDEEQPAASDPEEDPRPRPGEPATDPGPHRHMRLGRRLRIRRPRPAPEPTQEERWQEWRERRVRQHAVRPPVHA